MSPLIISTSIRILGVLSQIGLGKKLMKRTKSTLSVAAAAVAMCTFATGPAEAYGESNTWERSYGNATVNGTNTWYNQSVHVEGRHYIPSGAGSCRRLYAKAYDYSLSVIATASTSWKCSAGTHAHSWDIETPNVVGGPWRIHFYWEEKATSTTPDSERRQIGAVGCHREDYRCL
ncbi:hypothetical protein SUDANB96_06576 [Streptomyces sp. enrichment culture]